MQQVENYMVRPNGYGIRDSQQEKETVLGVCPACGDTVTDAHVYGTWEDQYFCDSHCFLKYMDYREVG